MKVAMQRGNPPEVVARKFSVKDYGLYPKPLRDLTILVHHSWF